MQHMRKHNYPTSSKMKVTQRQLDQFVVGSEDLCFLADKSKDRKDYWDVFSVSQEYRSAVKRMS